MGKGFKHGGAGLPLNFKIVGGTAQPSSPRENTIWVNTDSPIVSWCVTDVVPEDASPGSVVIATGAESACRFNALNKTGACISVSPVSVLHHVSGALEHKEAFIYQNGSWMQISSFVQDLYKNGQTPHEWTSRDGESNSPELIMGVTHWAFGGGYGDYGYKYTVQPILISPGFSKLSVKYYCTGTMATSSSPTHVLVLRTECNESNYCNSDGVVASVSIPPTAQERVVSLDIPESLWGQTLYVGAYYNSNANSSNPKEYHIQELWMES